MCIKGIDCASGKLTPSWALWIAGEGCGLITIIALMQTLNSYGPHEDNAGNLFCDVWSEGYELLYSYIHIIYNSTFQGIVR